MSTPSDPTAPAEGGGSGVSADAGAAERTLVLRAATPRDAALLLSLFGELAEYERLSHLMRADERKLSDALFGPRPLAEALIAERDSEAAGYALFFPTFSSFLSSAGMWLEDLFVRPAHRRHGVGRALLAAVAARTRERGGERLEWAALDWNELALGFYRALGASTMGEWITHRLEGEPLERLAAERTAAGGGGQR
jgi:GNAT superfamily N-acetyltransferase